MDHILRFLIQFFIFLSRFSRFFARLGIGEYEEWKPGGKLPLTEHEKDTLHHPTLPKNLYVADATILPRAMGNPPILTIMALAKKIATLV